VKRHVVAVLFHRPDRNQCDGFLTIEFFYIRPVQFGKFHIFAPRKIYLSYHRAEGS